MESTFVFNILFLFNLIILCFAILFFYICYFCYKFSIKTNIYYILKFLENCY